MNDLMDAHSQINASCIFNASSTMLSLYWTPLSDKCPLRVQGKSVLQLAIWESYSSHVLAQGAFYLAPKNF